MPTPSHSRRATRQFRQKRLLLVLAVVGGTALTVYAGHRVQVDRQAPALLDRARAAVSEKNWKAAIEAYNQFLKLRPREAAAHIERADACAAAGRYKDAVEGYLEGLAQDPDQPDARRRLAELYLAGRRWASAREQLRKAVGPTGKSSDPKLFLLLAECDRRENKLAEERKNLEAAVALTAAPPSAAYRLAELIRATETTPDAIAAADAILDRLVDSRPSDLESRLLRAAYRKKFGNAAGAKADLEFAHRNIPGAATNVSLLSEYVGLLQGDGEPQSAERVLRAARAADPANHTLSLMLVNVLFEARTPEKTREAHELVRQVSTALPDGDRRLLFLGDTLLDANDGAATRAAADRLAKLPAHADAARYLTGRLAMQAGDWITARADLTVAVKALSTEPPERVVAARAHLVLSAAHAAAFDSDAQLKAARAAESLATGAWATEAKMAVAEAFLRQDKRREAAEVLRTITTASPAARAALSRLRLGDALAHPTNAELWRAFDASIGTPPYPIEIALLVAQAKAARNDPTGLSGLEELVKNAPTSPELRLGLIALRGERDPAAAFKDLDAAVAQLGDRVELRLARAALLARDPRPLKAGELVRLATDPGAKFNTNERGTLLRGVAELLAARGFRPEALGLLRQAVELHPFDLTVRLQLFDVANAANDAEACAFALTEIRRLDTPTGPITRVAEVTRALATTPQPTPAELIDWRDKVAAAAEARRGWARPFALLGDLSNLEKKPSAALTHYEEAMRRGGSGRVAHAAVELLLSRQNYGEAMRLMEDLDRAGGLSQAMRNRLLLLRAASGENADGALAWVRSRELADSADYRDHLLRSFVFQLHDKPDEAKTALDVALGRNGTAPELWEARVRHCLGVSREDAVKEVDKAAAKLAENTADPMAVRLTLGRCREMVGQAEKAETEYKAAAKLDPEDRRPVERLHELYRRSGRQRDAELLLETLETQGGAMAKWARRQLAFARLERPDGFAKLSEAVALIDRNTPEDGEEAVEDVRAKAVVRAFDPLRRKESLATLATTLPRAPLTAGEVALYARLFVQGGQPEEAEKLLVAATSGGPRADLTQLALLASLQTKRGDLTAAKQTVNRLRLIDPFGWNTAVEMARLLAQTDKPAAAKVLLAHRAAGKPELKAYLVAPTLESFGCFDEAAKLLRDWHDTAKLNGRHIPLVEFLIRRNAAEEAISLAMKYEADIPTGVTARLLSGAVHARHESALPAGGRVAWRKLVDEVTKWVAAKSATAPTNPDLLFARAELADARGAYDEAIQLYGQAADRTEDAALKASLRNNRAWLMAVAHKDGGDEPLRLVNEAINGRGPLPSLLATRAAVRLAASKPAEALGDLDAAAAADPKPAYHFRRALAFDKSGKPDARDAALAEASKRGLTRADLHPLDWPDYDRLVKSK